MNISEDKFSNKSAEEIISDMLIQHKNNSKEALEHIQDILKDDGLTLSKDTKDNLEKAADILSDKGLKEGWLSNIISNKPQQTEEVKFEVYLPFKKEPAVFVTRASSLDDPQVEEAIKKIRRKHPKSTIYIRSKLGYKRITEDTKDKKSSGFMKSILSSDLVKNLAATGLAAFTGISPILTKPVTNGALAGIKSKFENTAQDYKVNLYTEDKSYTCYAGTLPIALTLAEKACGNYSHVDILKDDTVICSYDRSLKEWSTSTVDELKEDIYTDDDITKHAYVDFKKDTVDIDERTKLILCKLNPNLIDKRKPKWSNTLLKSPKIITVTDDVKGEVLIVLDGVENQVNQKNPDQTELTIREKVPVNVTDTGFVYKDGEAFVITAKQFKDILNAEENAKTLEKFEKSKGSAILNDEEAHYFLELDKIAKENIDARYPEWEATHSEIYNLDAYTLPERAEIYQAWKDANRTTSYQQARELTPEEVDKKFGLNKLKAQLKKENPKLLTAFETVRKGISNKEQAELDDTLLDVLNNSNDVNTELSQVIGYYGAKAQLNQLSKGKLNKLEDDLPEATKVEFSNKLKELITSKYLDSKSGLPKVVQNASEALKDITNVISTYSNTTKTSNWNQKIGSVKEVGEITTEILNTIKRINTTNPKIAQELKDRLIGSKNSWQKQQIVGNELITKLTEFLEYSMKVEDDVLNRAAEISDIKTAFSDPEQAEVRNKSIEDINKRPIIKSDQEVNHDNWIYMVKHIIDPSKDEKVRDRSYYTAITNKISRLVQNDPTAANGYHKNFNQLLKNLEAKYPNDPENPEIEASLKDFLDTMKDETKGYATISKSLDAAL